MTSNTDENEQLAMSVQKALDKEDDSKTVNSASDARVINNVVRHEYRVLSDQEKLQMKEVKDLGLKFIQMIDDLGSKREYSTAKTKMEEAVMWAVKGLTQ